MEGKNDLIWTQLYFLASAGMPIWQQTMQTVEVRKAELRKQSIPHRLQSGSSETKRQLGTDSLLL